MSFTLDSHIQWFIKHISLIQDCVNFLFMKKTILIIFLSLLKVSMQAQQIITLEGGSLSSNIVSTAPTRTIESVADGIMVTYTFSKALLDPDEVYENTYWWKVDGFGFNETLTEAALPIRTDQFVVPVGKTPSVEVISKEYVDFKYTLTPAREPLSDDNYQIYDKQLVKPIIPTNIWMPQNLVKASDNQVYRGNRIFKVTISPIQYNSSKETVRAYKKISYKVKFTDDNSNLSNDESKYIDYHDSFLQNITLNYDLLYSSQKSVSTNNQYNQDYLILSTSKYETAVNALAEWKKLCGFNVHIRIQDNWTETNVKKTIKSLYDSNPNLYYLLIIGDYEDVPACMSSLITSHVTDFFYGCMDGESDYTPDIYRGRLSVSTVNEAKTVVNKIIKYEKTPLPAPSFYEHGLNCAYFQDKNKDGYADRRFAQTSENVRDYLIKQGKFIQRVYVTETDITPTNWNKGSYSYGEAIPNELLKPSFAWNGNYNDINSAINNGVFYVLHRDHGSISGWSDPYYTKNHINQLANGDMLPIVFSLNCLTGKFNGTTCFAEHFLRKENGGCVAIFGATETSYSGYNDALTGGMFDAIWCFPGLRITIPNHSYNSVTPTPTYRLGQILDQGLERMNETYGGNNSMYIKYTKELFHCFGDPSMFFPTASPTAFSQRICTRASDKISVSFVDDGATISFYDHLKDHVTSYHGTSATFLTDNPKNITVCVTGHNRIPYISYGSKDGYLTIQNEVISGYRSYNADYIKIGSNVNDTQPYGKVKFENGEISINSMSIVIQPGTSIEKGTDFTINTLR